MIYLNRTTGTDKDFIQLVQLLDADLAIRDGADHAFYNQFNQSSHLQQVLVAYLDGQPVACGALKPFDATGMEVKRMFTLPQHRSKGFAARVLAALEAWASELGYRKCILETGRQQPEAIALYRKCGYKIITNYGPYAGIDNSVCFEKIL